MQRHERASLTVMLLLGLLAAMMLGLDCHGQTPPQPQLSKDEEEIFTWINIYRAQHKLPPMAIDPTLQSMARMRVSVFNHNHPRYGWSQEHARKLGFNGPVTDVIAQGYSDGADAVSGWSTSTGHAYGLCGYMNINRQYVNKHLNLVGVAKQGKNYIAVLGRREGNSQELKGKRNER